MRCVPNEVLLTDFMVWLLGDFVLKPLENLIFLKIDFADSVDFKQV